ncbi:MAG: lactonase family protein [Bacteroidales bacterium]|nr:lactonase family protein [Bacteroidales bacterium]
MTSTSLLISSLWMLIGSYSSTSDEGIKLYKFDQETAEFEMVSGLSGISNPSFLCVSANKQFIYAVGEDEGLTSTANSIALDLQRGEMRLIDTQLTNGGAPCNITISPDGHLLLTANYFGGNISMFKVSDDGHLSTAQTIQFSGSSVDPERQTKPYLHSVVFTPDFGKYLLANDLGTDVIHQYTRDVDEEGNMIIDLNNRKDIYVKAGAGPRHLCFSPSQEYFYLVSELSGEVFTFSYNDGEIRQLQCIKADEYDAGGSADIHISPDGRYVYASHRLKGDGVSIMKVREDCTLEKIGYQATGIHPRNFAITPNGKYLLVACRDTDEVEIYMRDLETGMLTDTGKRLKMPKPVCVKFIE